MGHSRRPSSRSSFSCRKNWYLKQRQKSIHSTPPLQIPTGTSGPITADGSTVYWRRDPAFMGVTIYNKIMKNSKHHPKQTQKEQVLPCELLPQIEGLRRVEFHFQSECVGWSDWNREKKVASICIKCVQSGSNSYSLLTCFLIALVGSSQCCEQGLRNFNVCARPVTYTW